MNPSRPFRALSASLLILAAGQAAAQAPGAESVSAPREAAALSAFGVEVSIRYYDARVYYVGDSIHVKVTVHNSGAAPFRFKLSEERVFSVSFEARTPANRLLAASDAYKRTVAASAPVFYREIALEPGEEYSFVEDAGRFIALSEPGLYSLRAIFRPELLRPGSGGPSIASNILTLSLRPATGLPGTAPPASAVSGEVLRPEKIAPDEVVRRTIVARQKGRWEEFYLYLDLESLLRRNESLRLRYDRESDPGRRRMLEVYRADLRLERVDVDIAVVPSAFEVVETLYTAEAGTVHVTQRFAYSGFSMIKDYSYELRKRDDVWYVVGYTVRNRGTE